MSGRVLCNATKVKETASLGPTTLQRPHADAFGRPYQPQQQQQQQQQQFQHHWQQPVLERDADRPSGTDLNSSSSSGTPAVVSTSTSTSGRNNVVPFCRKALVSPVPPSSPNTDTNTAPHDNGTTSSSSSSSSSAITTADPSSATTTSSSSSSGCPFLQAMQPPLVNLPWWQRVWQITQPYRFQRLVLHEAVGSGGHSVAALDAAPGFESAYVPGTGAAVRGVLAGDGGSEPCTGPALVPFFGEWQCVLKVWRRAAAVGGRSNPLFMLSQSLSQSPAALDQAAATPRTSPHPTLPNISHTCCLCLPAGYPFLPPPPPPPQNTCS